MYILPYFTKESNASSLPLTQLWLFLAHGGTQVWQTDPQDTNPTSIVREYLEANGLYGTPYVKGDCLYYAIDTQRTNIKSFYTWLDVGGEDLEHLELLECWRPFFWLGDTTTTWGWVDVANNTSFGPFGTLVRIWNDIVSLKG